MPGNHGRFIHAGGAALDAGHQQAWLWAHKARKIIAYRHKTLAAASPQIANNARQIVNRALVRIVEQKDANVPGAYTVPLLLRSVA